MTAGAGREVTLEDLRTTEAVLREQLVDAEAVRSLLGISTEAAESVLTARLRPALWLVAMLVLASRLRGTDSSRDEIEEAMLIFRLVRRKQKTEPAPDLTQDDVRALQAALQGQPDATALAAFLGQEIEATRAFLLVAGESRVLDSVLLTHLVARLHGVRVDPQEVLYASLAVLEHESARLRRAQAN